jgi:4-hydroxymandelate oxidase
VDLTEVRKKAKELMNGRCRMCPECDGRACAGEVPGMGAAGTGGSFKNAYSALAGVKLNMRVIHDAADPDMSCELLGQSLALPILGAPVAGVKLNMGCDEVSEADYCLEFVRGCEQSGILGCFGDAVPDFFFEAGMAALDKMNGKAIPVLKPFEEKFLFPKLEQVVQAGAPMVGLDLDAAGLIIPRLHGHPVYPKTPAELRRIVDQTSLPLILKGVMTPEEAQMAVDVGAKGIVVSNHGGRVMDHLPGTAQVLPGIAKQVKGQICIMADGGVRDGVDVLKMLALGADAVMIGRPLAIAALGGGAEGVKLYMEQVKSQLYSAMILAGCNDLAKIGPQVIFQG